LDDGRPRESEAAQSLALSVTPGTQPPWDKAMIRLGEVTLGTLCALLVSWLIDAAERRWFVRR
jgi:hypothetical protein